MATNVDLSGNDLKVRFSQLARAELPFNPVEGVAVTGMNVERLKNSMQAYGWADPRFVTQEQAEANGWKISPDAKSVGVERRDVATGSKETLFFINAENVKGMPSLDEMLAMPNDKLSEMYQRWIEVDEDLSIAPAKREIEVPRPLAPESTLDTGELGALGEQEPSQAGNAKAAAINGTAVATDKRLAVMAPYWLNGLHNAQGLDLAAQINKEIKQKKLAEDKEAVAKLLSIYANAQKLGLVIVPEQRYLNDPHLKANPAQPLSLLNGALVR